MGHDSPAPTRPLRVLGWNDWLGRHIGMNTGSRAAALLGVAVAMLGIMLPPTILTYSASQWGRRNRELRAVRAFQLGWRRWWCR